MKKLLAVFLLCFQYAYATTYYVKASGGSGSGLSDTDAWNLAKFNSTYINIGDTVLFKRGDVFYGTFNIFSGSASLPRIYSTYGAGANPKITGLTSLTNWTLLSNNIYYTDVSNVVDLNVVVLDGVLTGMGRYPKAGYISCNLNPYNSQVIIPSKSLPFNPAGAEAVIRKTRQVTDRQKIDYYSGENIGLSTYDFGGNYSNNSAYVTGNGNGFFVQRTLGAVTQNGDWYYDSSSKRLYMYFADSNPAAHVVKASSIDIICEADNINYVTFQDIDFEGGNYCVINSNGINHVTFNDCNFAFSNNGIRSNNGTTYLALQGGSMSNLTNYGMLIQQSVSNVVVDSLVLNNIGIIQGAGGSGDAQQLGIWIMGDNTTVKNCLLTNIGYHGIVQIGNNTLAEKNFVSDFGKTKDDCGGIYDIQFANTPYTNKIIRNNIILNAYGNGDGINDYATGHPEASGIYLDNSYNVLVTNNVIAHGSFSGIVTVDDKTGIQITNNLVYDHKYQLQVYQTGANLRNATVTGNRFIAKTTNQYAFYYHTYINDIPSQFGSFNNNIYARPIDDTNTFLTNKDYNGGGGVTNFSLSDWKTKYSQDASSAKSAVTTSSLNDMRFDYNNKGFDATVSLDCFNSDVANNLYISSITLASYSGSVLIKTNFKPTIEINK